MANRNRNRSQRLVRRLQLQIAWGRFVRVMQLRRQSLGVLSACSRWLVRGRSVGPLTTAVRAELLKALCLLPVMFTDLRFVPSPLVTVSDASLEGAGA